MALASEGLRDTNTLSYQFKTNKHRPVWVAGRANREGGPALLSASEEPKGSEGNELEPRPSGQSGPGKAVAVNNRYQSDTRLENTT